MEAQFIRIAGELGWGLDTQIAKLEEFVAVSGRDAEWLDATRGRRLQGVVLRDALLQFIGRSGRTGNFTRFLLAQIPPPARAVTEAPAAAPAVAPVSRTPAAGRRAGLMGWLRRRGPANVE